MSDSRRSIWPIVAAALVVRLLLMFVRGEYLVYDEGYYLLLARSLRAGHGFTLNGLPHVALSPLQPVLVALLSLTGLPDLWASRLLAAVCGALLAVPVASLAARWLSPRGVTMAALFTALHPALLTLLPFFPGESWNLYFGSEPLYLLLATSALAAGAKATGGGWRWWVAAGALGALAYLTRLEGIVLSALLGCALLVALWRAGQLARWPRATVALAAGVVVAAPYVWYLHGALGRWALSGRVQAAVSETAPALPAPPASPRDAPPQQGGSNAVRDFVWGGDTETLWRTLYALDAAGTQMASQYWGVPRAGAAAPRALRVPATDNAAIAPQPATLGRESASAAPAAPAGAPSQGALSTLVRAIAVVLPLWFIALALIGGWAVAPKLDAALWLTPMIVAALAPALLAYAEPRALLMLVPAGCLLAAAAVQRLAVLAEARAPQFRAPRLLPGLVALLLAWPTAHDLARSWSQQTPLQQLSAARRVVGEYLGAHLPADARIVSWHPAIAIWARREWRVLPYEPLERIVGYARAQEAGTVVLSRFDPSPLRDPPRAFTAMLIDSTSSAHGQVRLDPVDATPSLFVGRLAPADSAPRP